PAWGGSTRLPRLIGEENAAEVILKGKLYSAPEALRLGLVDQVVPRDKLLEAARKKLAEGKRPAPKISQPKAKTPVPADSKSARRESRIAGPGSRERRKDLCRCGQARPGRRRKSEARPGPHCCFDCTDGIARCRVYHRGRFGKDRHQERDFQRALDAGRRED